MSEGVSLKELENQLIAKAWQDEAFKEELLRNPRETFIRELQLQGFPDTIDVQVLEETPKTLYLVLPMKPDVADNGELSDAELESVAGGIWGFIAYSAVKTLIGGIKKCLK